jgi:hypothetical protein
MRGLLGTAEAKQAQRGSGNRDALAKIGENESELIPEIRALFDGAHYLRRQEG